MVGIGAVPHHHSARRHVGFAGDSQRLLQKGDAVRQRAPEPFPAPDARLRPHECREGPHLQRDGSAGTQDVFFFL